MATTGASGAAGSGARSAAGGAGGRLADSSIGHGTGGKNETGDQCARDGGERGAPAGSKERGTRAGARDSAASGRPMPVMKGHWLKGTLGRIRSEPLAVYGEAWRRYGDYVSIRALPGIYFYLLVHPDAVEHVLAKNARNYRKPDVLIKPVSKFLGNGIFASDGELWLRQRRLMQPAFGRAELANLGAGMARRAQELVEEWRRGPAGRPVDMAQEMMRLTLGIVSRALFSRDVSAEADELGQAIRNNFHYVSDRMNSKPGLPLWVPTATNRRFRHHQAVLEGVVLRLIEERRQSPGDQRDLLGTLLAAEDEETGEKMSDRQLKDEVMTLLLAGHDTVGAALSWAWYLLAEHPDIQRDLHDEAAAALGDGLPSAADLGKLPLARAVFEETLRLYPPAWGLPRESIGPDEIGGRAIRPKTIITLSQWLTHRHPDYWERPEEFRPSRFLERAAANRSRYAYFPFGAGPRVCIGNNFALMEGTLILAQVARAFRVELVPGQAITPDTTFTLRPKEGVRVTLEAWRDG